MYDIMMPLGRVRSNESVSNQLDEFMTATLPYVVCMLYLVLFIFMGIMIFMVCRIIYEFCTSDFSDPPKNQPSNPVKLQIFDLECYSSMT